MPIPPNHTLPQDSRDLIRIRGARQHNLRHLDVDIRTGELTVVTGPSGSGKSSLVFDTLYAEGQRRYVETFSAWARQFLERMDRPAVDALEGVPPAIAIDQVNPVRNSRSTVGTMSGINDHLKLLFAHAAQLFDRHTAGAVRQDTAHSICAAIGEDLQQRAGADGVRIAITFAVRVAPGSTAQELRQWLAAGGFVHIQAERMEDGVPVLEVVADRFRWTGGSQAGGGQDASAAQDMRLHQAVESALQHGDGQMALHVLCAPGGQGAGSWRRAFSRKLHCPASGLHYREPQAAHFSFNSPLGACAHCRGFGRVIGVDWDLVVPDARLTLREGAIKPVQTPAWQDIQRDLLRHAEREGIPRDTPWQQMEAAQRAWVLDGSPRWNGKWSQTWYGLRRFFEYLESKAYKTHIRVLLSRYRSYTLCPVCRGARLQEESLLWRLGDKAAADAVLPPAKRFMPPGVRWTQAQLEALPGLGLHDLMCLPLDRLRDFLARCAPDAEEAGASAAARRRLHAAMDERLQYLCDVGLGYLTLERQSRTLSGGEVQRINLTTALGTSLTGTLFVLDEPSIGLHPRDMQRIIHAMRRLTDAGNTLVVVEHDPALMLAADRIIDMGPGPGAAGGCVVFDGPAAALRHADTRTGAYLGGRRHVGFGPKRAVLEATPRLVLHGARRHNLRGLDVAFPLQRLVVVSGVSGSGKSTLIHDVLAPALLRHFGRASAQAGGAFERLAGAGQIGDVVVMDQLAPGKSARSTPASYVGAWDGVRKLLAGTALAQQRGYTASTFSFNSGDGRCPACGGAGFEHVEMQFLADVYLRCTECGGQRWRREVLDVMLDFTHADGQAGRAHAADLLEWTVQEAADRLQRLPDAAARDSVRALQALLDVGLHYLRLGQSVPTLSGGEAQRLKLAGFLAEAARRRSGAQPDAGKGTLFLLDEPTTGLHFDDIACLLRALRKLLHAGHSVIVIEHNLDIIRASDWLIDMGPEGGDGGGQIIAQGPPERLRQHPTSHTARALRAYDLGGEEPAVAMHEAPARVAAPQAIAIHGAREHNLRAVSVRIPHSTFTVITGVSGSGKSTLAFDILFHEGQRRYLESINAWARSLVQGGSREADVERMDAVRPTVAVAQRSARAGHQSTVGTSTEIWPFLRLLYVKLGVQADGRPAVGMEPHHFSWSHPLGWCPHCRGSGWAPQAGSGPGKKRKASPRSGRERSFAELEQEQEQEAPAPDARPCPVCHGARLAPAALAVRLCGKNIAELASLPLDGLHAWMVRVPDGLDARAARIARDPLAEILRRLQFLQSVGLGYLTLARTAPSLSGGEAQRMRLAAQLGSPLQGVCYVLDEPTIGLHPRDNHRLLDALEQLADRGNTLVVVEHDAQTIRRARHIIDMGPGAGIHGGRVVAQGSLQSILRQPESLTGQCLQHGTILPEQVRRQSISDTKLKNRNTKIKNSVNDFNDVNSDTKNVEWLHILGAHRHNLQALDVAVPLKRLVAVTGVSGSGKSTLAREVLLESLIQGSGVGCRSLRGRAGVARVLEVDQSPIGKTPRSCPATYIGVWDAIRKLFAQSLYAREQGWTAGRFSFNTAAGRCPVCAGQGVRTVEMRFLPDIQLPCEACHGARFQRETLQALWRGHNIAQVLNMRAEQAAEFFASMPAVARPLQLLCDMGLGYLTLGQPSPTLSGGEAQRVKLVAELARAEGSRLHTLYVLDEPTVGLHMHDVQRLGSVLHRLVDAGHSVITIEHDLDIIAQADWVIDLGPEGGTAGGRVVFAGTPQDLVRADTHTGRALARQCGRCA